MSFEIFGTVLPSWQIFATIGIFCMILEVFVTSFVMLPIGLAFILTALMTPLSDNGVIQSLILSVNLVVIFAVFQKWARPFFKKNTYKTNIESIIGQTAIVTEDIDSNHAGYVKLYGDNWQANSIGDQKFIAGESVLIKEIDGNKVIVDKRKKD